MGYIRASSKLGAIIGLEIFVFASFIGICAIINWLIVGIPNIPEQPLLNLFYASLKVGISLLFVGVWLFTWYYFTKKLMITSAEKKND